MAKRFNLKTNGNSKQDTMKFRLAHYLRLGLTLDEACKLTECSKATLNNLRCDMEFEDFIQRCVAENKANHLANIESAALSGAWQASAWYLERKFPNEFGKKDIVRHEYQIKIQTLTQSFIKVINEQIEDKHLRFKIANALRNFDFDGSGVMDHTFKPKLLEHKEIIDVGDE